MVNDYLVLIKNGKNSKKMDNYYEFEFENKKYFFRKYPEDKYKNLVFCCAKNEDEYIREYIEHYLKIGFDKIIIVDNNEEPGLEKIIEDHIARGSVQIFPFNGVHGYFQNAIYTMFMNYGNYKWCAYFDCDEFLEISGRYDNVEQMLDEADADAFMVQWMCFGANEKLTKEEGTVQERFPLPYFPLIQNPYNMYVKTVLRGGVKGYFDSPHNVVINGDNPKYNVSGIMTVKETNIIFPFISYKHCYLKHYITKSYEEFQAKYRKGRISPAIDDAKDFFCMYRNNYFKSVECFLYGGGFPEDFDMAIEAYNMICMMENSCHVYKMALYAMSHSTGKVFVVDESMEDHLFTILLQESIKSRNTLIAAQNDTNILWNLFVKYKKEDDKTYYIYGKK